MIEERLIETIDSGLEYIETLKDIHNLVYKVRTESGIYVLKISFKESRIQQVHRERQVLPRLAHIPEVPMIVRDYGSVLGYDAILKEYCAGTTLDEYRGELDFDQLEQLVIRIHEAGIARLDIRQPNILITEQGIRLFDFGTSIQNKVWNYIGFITEKGMDKNRIRALRDEYQQK